MSFGYLVGLGFGSFAVDWSAGDCLGRDELVGCNLVADLDSLAAYSRSGLAEPGNLLDFAGIGCLVMAGFLVVDFEDWIALILAVFEAALVGLDCLAKTGKPEDFLGALLLLADDD